MAWFAVNVGGNLTKRANISSRFIIRTEIIWTTPPTDQTGKTCVFTVTTTSTAGNFSESISVKEKSNPVGTSTFSLNNKNVSHSLLPLMEESEALGWPVLTLVLFILTFFLVLTTNIILYSMYFALSNRKIDINFLLLGWNIGKYMKVYKQTTKEELGKVGKLYYLAYIFLLASIIFFLAALTSLYS